MTVLQRAEFPSILLVISATCKSHSFAYSKFFRCSSYNTVTCDILKPPEQVPAVQAQSSETGLVSAGPETTPSVAAIMETSPFSEVSESIGIGPDRSYSN
jgi:hypothetical protein